MHFCHRSYKAVNNELQAFFAMSSECLRLSTPLRSLKITALKQTHPQEEKVVERDQGRISWFSGDAELGCFDGGGTPVRATEARGPPIEVSALLPSREIWYPFTKRGIQQ
ncbi:hypothetical protein AVEN_205253-1 [Araneus ventricosus]|uniref:Uncharacterized protein n=1 Tax=Araneus ventricosus TaxID=182803 RepID=A0A4Y2VMC4_ARAVE|nr:hypothetical protein AVEN_205253-1 [Araneus ventricosus]